MSIVYEPHVCDTPPTFNDPWVPVMGSEPAPSTKTGTIWRCNECGRHWWFEMFSGLGFWHRVRFWNLIAKHHIRKAAQ